MGYEKAAKVILGQCLDVKRNERVLVIADKNTKDIGQEIFDEAKKIAKAEFVLIPVGEHNGEEPPKEIARRILDFDVIIAPTTKSLSHTNAMKAARDKGSRVATLPGITSRIMQESVVADYEKIAAFSEKLKAAVEGKKHVQITTPAGTDLRFSIQGRTWLLDTGIIREPGKGGNIPAGEVFIAPLEKTASGVIVIDNFVHEKEVYAGRRTKIFVKKGKAEGISDEKCRLAAYFRDIKNARNIAEFGIGTNEKARIIGNILQDEKVLGTCHLAFGNSSAIGGKVYSELHIDTVLQKPTIVVDGKMIMRRGSL